MNKDILNCATKPRPKSSLMRRHIVRQYLELLLRNDFAKAPTGRAGVFIEKPSINFDLTGVEKLHSMVIIEEEGELSSCAL